MYINGKGTEKNFKKAVELYEKPASRGDASALFQLAKMYETGHGVSVDYLKAHQLYKLSEQSGNYYALFQS